MKTNKYEKTQETEQKRTVIFPVNWTGNRVPEFVIMPNGKKVKVSNMRNSTIIFDDGSSGNYKRTMDNNETNERSITIELEME